MSCSGKSIHYMIKALGLLEMQGGAGENNQEQDEEDAVIKKSAIKAMLENSFQKPLKDAARECSTVGNQLEIPILKSWNDAIKDSSYPRDRNLHVLSAYKVGLVSKKGNPVVKDSVDFHLHMVDLRTEEIIPVGFEAKGRVTAKSAYSEEDYLLENVRDVHVFAKCIDVCHNIASPSER